MHKTLALAHASAARAVHADRVNLVDICERVVPLGELDDLPDRRDVAIHGIEAFEDDQLGAIAARLDQELLEMSHVVVAPNLLFAAGPAHALDH